jgi:hypothetical protein
MAEAMPAPTPTHCAVCGLPLGLRYWIVHVEVALWRALRSPATQTTVALRRLLTELGRARRGWPRRDARATYDALEPRCRAAMMRLGRR